MKNKLKNPPIKHQELLNWRRRTLSHLIGDGLRKGAIGFVKTVKQSELPRGEKRSLRG